jgi:hypothetical protein
MTMPKAAIDKDSQTLLWKNKVRLSKDWRMASPTRDFRDAKEVDQLKLCIPIAATTNPRHHSAPFRACENVRHGGQMIWETLAM